MIKDNAQKKLLSIWPACVVTFVFAFLFMIQTDVSAENNKPVARIDGTLNVRQGEMVYLDGTNSSDPSASGYPSLTYRWTLLSSPSGSTAVLNPSGAQVSFEADAAGTYKVKLVVNNGSSDSNPAYAEIRAAAGQ